MAKSDEAWTLGGRDWRAFMALTREIACELAADGTIEITQKGEALPADTKPSDLRGPIRLRLTRRKQPGE